jgi:RHH-type rel operon transcriptional repressor/antitoxin RelB
MEKVRKRSSPLRTFSMTRSAIVTHLEELEDYYLAERVMEKVRKGEERLFSLDDVERDLGLES